MDEISAQTLALEKVFSDSYVVPDYQREYVWTESEVSDLLEDISSACPRSSNAEEQAKASDYFIGSIVVCESKSEGASVFELIDGQQRLTTLIILFCAIRDYLEQLDAKPIGTLNQCISDSQITPQGEVLLPRVGLQYEEAQGVLADIIEGNKTDLVNSSASATNLQDAYEICLKSIRRDYHKPSEIIGFCYYILQKVKLIRIHASSRDGALRIFETINNRGLSLDSMDLLKNLMFINSRKSDYSTIKKKWKQLIDILYKAKEKKPLRFLRYYTWVRFNLNSINEREVYDVLKDRAKDSGLADDPLGFLDDLIKAAKAYANYLQGKTAKGEPCPALANIYNMSHAAKAHLVFLLAAMDWPDPWVNNLAEELENYFFCTIIISQPARITEQKTPGWLRSLKKVTDADSLKLFLESTFKQARVDMSTSFWLRFSELQEESLRRYQIKYVLAKCAKWVDDCAYGQDKNLYTLGSYLDPSVTVEHILPQKPCPKALKEFGKTEGGYESYVHRLGNLTPVSKGINSTLGNRAFSQKQASYAASKILITRHLAGDIHSGTNTAINRTSNLLGSSPKQWGAKEVDDRQQMLCDLACHVWNIPVPREKTE